MRIQSALVVLTLNVLSTSADQSNPPQEVDCDVHYYSNWIEHVIFLIKDGCHVSCQLLQHMHITRGKSWISVGPQKNNECAAGFVSLC